MALGTTISLSNEPVQRMSRANLKSLKQKTNYTTSWQFSIQRFLINLVQDTISAFVLAFNQRQYSCAESGHVLAVRRWRAGDIPVCAHCGKLVMGLRDLERAVPAQLPKSVSTQLPEEHPLAS
jgi:hypothetical protein